MSLEDIDNYTTEYKIKRLEQTQQYFENLKKDYDFVARALYAVLCEVDNGCITDWSDIKLSKEDSTSLRKWFDEEEKKRKERRKEIAQKARAKLTQEEIEALGL